MIEDPKQFVEFLARHRLSSDQFLFMFLIYKENYTSLYIYTEQVKGLHPEEIQDLVRRGYLRNENSAPGDYFADSFIVTEKFTAVAFDMTNKDAATEFWDAYPPILYIDGKRFSATAVNKELFLEKYTKKIGYSKRLHKKVMAALTYGKQINAVNMGIEKWFQSEQWNQLEKEMNETGTVKRYGDKEF